MTFRRVFDRSNSSIISRIRKHFFCVFRKFRFTILKDKQKPIIYRTWHGLVLINFAFSFAIIYQIMKSCRSMSKVLSRFCTIKNCQFWPELASFAQILGHHKILLKSANSHIMSSNFCPILTQHTPPTSPPPHTTPTHPHSF